MLSGKRILLGVTGGIAAYKAAFLLREFQKSGGEVRVTMTPAATRFVGENTFSSLTHNKVGVNFFPEKESRDGESWTRHIEWGEWADLYVIAPCTANTLAKLVNGFADNMLTSTVLAARCPVLICPTMDGEMYQKKVTKENIAKAQDLGYHIMEPAEGYLASGMEGRGRLPEISDIIEKCEELLSSPPDKKKDRTDAFLKGKKVLVTAGPTREHLDPVRFISNPSSGKMGFAMAEAAHNFGSDVTLIHGPVTISPPKGISTIEIESASELFEKVRDHANSDIIIMAAAVSDFTPENRSSQKIKKDKIENVLKLKSTRDILSWLGENKKKGQILIGFAMETENLLENARKKLRTKNIDWIIANSLTEPESGFKSDTNTVVLIGNNTEQKMEGLKKDLAYRLLKRIFVS